MRRCAISRIAEFAVYEFTMDGLCIVMLINTLSCMKGCFVVSGQTFGGKNMKKLLAIILTLSLIHISIGNCQLIAWKAVYMAVAGEDPLPCIILIQQCGQIRHMFLNQVL